MQNSKTWSVKEEILEGGAMISEREVKFMVRFVGTRGGIMALLLKYYAINFDVHKDTEVWLHLVCFGWVLFLGCCIQSIWRHNVHRCVEQRGEMGVECGQEVAVVESQVGRTLGWNHPRKKGFADFMLLNYQKIQNVRTIMDKY